MSRIIASASQRKCRNLFREAVAYAKTVIADPVKKEKWQKRLKRHNGVYNAAITQYMLEAKKQQQLQQKMEEINKLIRNAFQKPVYESSVKHGLFIPQVSAKALASFNSS